MSHVQTEVSTKTKPISKVGYSNLQFHNSFPKRPPTGGANSTNKGIKFPNLFWKIEVKMLFEEVLSFAFCPGNHSTASYAYHMSAKVLKQRMYV